MAKNPQKIRIKDIAEMAGVSAGTVDRVLHGRGKVSPAALKAVEEVLNRVNYNPNIYLSSISIRKRIKIVFVTPHTQGSQYWQQIHEGFSKALNEYSVVDLTSEVYTYDQYDLYNCRTTYSKVLEAKPDAVVIGPTFKDETIRLTQTLDEEHIPYAYVDSMVEGTNPMAFYSAKQDSCGYLIAKLIRQTTPADSEYALFQAMRVGDESANNTIQRKIGFMEFFHQNRLGDKVHRLNFSPLDKAYNDKALADFFAAHPNVKGAAVLSSRGSIITDSLKRIGINHIKTICLDPTSDNVAAMMDGHLDFLVGQRPELQGFLAVETLLKNIICGGHPAVENYMPLDIITRENIDFYKEYVVQNSAVGGVECDIQAEK
ncbi:MAG: substrate-binding domain-containing protein [Tidjanibacter sp.]|nr:substrate-binding domain-containing protein [Tidjanibacter sp.]